MEGAETTGDRQIILHEDKKRLDSKDFEGFYMIYNDFKAFHPEVLPRRRGGLR